MAAAEWQPEHHQSEKNSQCRQQQPFDAALLCRKLEAARRERDEREAFAQLRRQRRENVGKDNSKSRNDEKRANSKRTSMIDSNERTSWYKLPNRSQQHFSSNGKWGDDIKQPYTTIDVEIPEHEPVDLASPGLDEDVTNHILLSQSPSVDEADAIEQRCKKEKVKRGSFMLLKDLVVGDKTETRRDANSEKRRPTDAAKRRSQTLPLLKTKFMPAKQSSVTTQEWAESPQHFDGAEKGSAPLTGFENEYTISFDTCHLPDAVEHPPDGSEPRRPLPMQRPSWASGMGMRSLLNLPLMPKKDKTPAGLDKVRSATLDADPPPVRRPHTRSQTAPENLISEAVARLKKEEKAKKRRSIGGFLEMLLPNHSMSHHEYTI